MLKRYFFSCDYDGTDFSGWQCQPNAPSIQEAIEDRLSKLIANQAVKVVGCGRTDAGVHAQGYYFHLDIELPDTASQVIYKLNKMLPTSIVINNIIEVSNDAHARFDATERTYHYFINQKKSPFINKYSCYYPFPLNLTKMNDAAKILLGKQDFTSFSKLHTDVNNNFCEIFKAKWSKIENGQLQFEIKANRFLRNMVRAIVGTLLEVGRERIKPDEIKKIIALKNRGEAGFSVPAKGLFLAKIEYPFLK